MSIKINYEILGIDEIIRLDNNDYSIPLTEKIIKLGEEIGDMTTARVYLTKKDYIEEAYDAFNISVAIYNTVKGLDLNKDVLKAAINNARPDNKLEVAIPIFYGKICGSLLLKLDSNNKSRNSQNTDIESYSFELILLLASQLKYIIDEDIEFEEIVNKKLNKWEEKQKDYFKE